MSTSSESKGDFVHCACGSLAQLRTTKNGANAGREYWGCARNFNDPQRCKFFKWNDSSSNNFNHSLTTNKTPYNSDARKSNSSSNSSSSSSSNNNHTTSFSTSSSDNDQAPLCPRHHIACIQRRVVKEGPTKGRLFWTCTAAQNCYFEWCSEGTKPAAYLDHPSSYRGGAFSSITIESNIKLGPPYIITFQIVGSNILQQANKQLKDRHETLSIQKDNYDCILMTLPRLGTVTNKLVKSLYDLFAREKKITKFNDLEFIIPLTEHATLKKLLLETRVDGAQIIIVDFPEGTKLLLNHYPAIDLSNVDALCEELNFKEKLPKYVNSKLRPFQKQGIAFAVKRNGKVLFGDEMGVGKTLQGFSTMYYFKEDWPLLIICPASLKHNWGKEIEDWFITGERGVHSDITTENIKIIENSKQIPDGYINIISYTVATNMLAEKPQDENDENAILNGVKFKCVICDESHSLKNSGTKRSQKIAPFLQKVKRLVMITGTPALSRPKELYSQLSLLLDREFRFTKSAFTIRYCDAKETLNYVDDNGSSNVMELNYLLSRTVMIRRRKESVLSELPPKQRQRVLLDIDAKDLKRIKFSAEKMKSAVEKMKHAMTKEDHYQNNFEKNSEVFRMYNMTGVAKLPAVKEYITEMIENTGDLKFLVFAYHTEVLDGIEECVAKELAKFYKLKLKDSELEKKMRGDYYIRIDGSTDSSKRQTLVTNFKQNGHCRVAILSIKAAGVGYTMTPCSTVLFAELYWTPSDLRQAEDRVHRIGQQNSVHIKYLLGKGTFDEYLWPMLQRKLDVVGKSVDGESHVDENVQQVEFERRETSLKSQQQRRMTHSEEEEIAEMYENFEKNQQGKKKLIHEDSDEENSRMSDDDNSDDLESPRTKNHHSKQVTNRSKTLVPMNNTSSSNITLNVDRMVVTSTNHQERKRGLDILRQLMNVPKNGDISSLPPNVRDALMMSPEQQPSSNDSSKISSQQSSSSSLLKTLSSLSTREGSKTFNRSFRDDQEEEQFDDDDSSSTILAKKSLLKKRKYRSKSDDEESDVPVDDAITHHCTSSSLLPQTPKKQTTRSTMMRTSPFFKNSHTSSSQNRILTQLYDQQQVNDDQSEETTLTSNNRVEETTMEHVDSLVTQNDSSSTATTLFKLTNAFKRSAPSTTPSNYTTSTTTTVVNPSDATNNLLATTRNSNIVGFVNNLSTPPSTHRPSPRLLMNGNSLTTTTTTALATPQFTRPPITTSSIPSIPSPVGNSTKSSPTNGSSSTSSNLAQLFEKYSFKKDVGTTSTPSSNKTIHSLQGKGTTPQTKQVPTFTPPVRAHASPNNSGSSSSNNKATTFKTPSHSTTSHSPSNVSSTHRKQQNGLEPETKKIKTSNNEEHSNHQAAPLLDDDFILDDDILPDII
ncbi:hypothetical protein C9374_013659 [Naegleria lovaniensis]|uniref:Uncharacterized protein n=1 Tax=Naegleria lovaniensis TaxID=51637 RepID=A0AA88KDT9_NAELO|nr:uncharacterized protein C9374_013659 [Naegleria lovaniensis]KAG2372651.1 hypothetical protein C9374_013659 [Naegleria lovaniensis]